LEKILLNDQKVNRKLKKSILHSFRADGVSDEKKTFRRVTILYSRFLVSLSNVTLREEATDREEKHFRSLISSRWSADGYRVPWHVTMHAWINSGRCIRTSPRLHRDLHLYREPGRYHCI